MVAVEPPLREQIGDHGFIVIAGDGFAQHSAKGEAKGGIAVAMSEGSSPDKDFAAGVALAVVSFPARIEGGELGFELALAVEQFLPPLIVRFSGARHRGSIR